MKRLFVAIEGDIPVLETDIEEQDFDAAGCDPDEERSEEDYEESAVYAAQRMLGHTGLEVYDARHLRTDIW